MQVTEQQQEEVLAGMIEIVTFHAPDTGFSIVKVKPFKKMKGMWDKLIPVVVSAPSLYPGATMDFYGHYIEHPKFGRQFKANRAVERRPADVNALERYIGSGLIHGIGPKTAQKIVKYFKEKTLEIFEEDIERLLEVPGIAAQKLEHIRDSWQEHREIRNVMMFLQNFGISTLYAIKIYKQYGAKAITVLQENPYQLAKDIYGIGFLTADKLALKLGFEHDSPVRLKAAIQYILTKATEEGHCFLYEKQIKDRLKELIEGAQEEQLMLYLEEMKESGDIPTRMGKFPHEGEVCYYNKKLFFDEMSVATQMKKRLTHLPEIALNKELDLESMLSEIITHKKLTPSEEQKESVLGILKSQVSILTGGPGCGKTTTTKLVVEMLKNLDLSLVLAAPTGRAAQRMSEVIGLEAKTIHRLLIFNPKDGRFKKNELDPIVADFVIVDECSMMDVSLMSSLLKAVGEETQLLMVGDADQLPSVGAGDVLRDFIKSKSIPCFHLTQVFRQALESDIIKYAHEINTGKVPAIGSPLESPDFWKTRDCLFIDADELTQEQIQFIRKCKQVVANHDDVIVEKKKKSGKVFMEHLYQKEDFFVEKIGEEERDEIIKNRFVPTVSVPAKFQHADLTRVVQGEGDVEELKSILRKVHPWSTLHFGMTACEMVKKIYTDSIKQYVGKDVEIQILSPMTKGALGTHAMNKMIQDLVNPEATHKRQVILGDKILRVGDRVIQKRNNYDLGVFNGDIGKIRAMEGDDEWSTVVEFGTTFDKKIVVYSRESLIELDLSYAITIHKSQGSEFDVVIIPVMTQHFRMLFRNLIYTGLTRAKKMAVFIGMRKAFNLGIHNINYQKRQTYLKELL